MAISWNDVITLVCGFIGLVLATFIHRTKRSGKTLVCPIGSDCDAVVHSEYSTLFHIPIETVGALYYFIITLTFATFLAFPSLHAPGATLIILEMTTVAFAFSVYLTALQAWVIKEWCTWCLSSALVCTVIFITQFHFIGFDLTNLLYVIFFR